MLYASSCSLSRLADIGLLKASFQSLVEIDDFRDGGAGGAMVIVPPLTFSSSMASTCVGYMSLYASRSNSRDDSFSTSFKEAQALHGSAVGFTLLGLSESPCLICVEHRLKH